MHIQIIISLAGTEGSTVSSLTCDHWLMLGLETLGHYLLLDPQITDGVPLHVLVSH